MDYIFLAAALAVAIHTFTYARWLRRQGNKAGAAFAYALSLLCVLLPAWRLLTLH